MATKNRSSTKKAAQPKAKATGEHLAATAKADQANARLRDERAKSKDGQTNSERAMVTSKKPAEKATAKASTKKAKKPGKLSAIDAALKVLADAKKPMNCGELIEAMAAKKLWSSPNGKTPAATLYSAILRDLQRGKDARFRKAERGQFTLAKKGA